MDALATPGELETHLQRDVEPDRAALALQLASGAVRAYCGWQLSQTQETLVAAPNGTIVLTLPTLRLNNVSKVSWRGVDLDITPLHMSFTRRGQIIRMGGWPAEGEIEVECDHGYVDIPDVIKLLVLEQAARHMANPEGLVQATVGRVSRTYATTTGSSGSARLNELDQRLLTPYRLN